MQAFGSELKEIKYIIPSVYPDQRGSFLEMYHMQRYNQKEGFEMFKQDNLSISKKNVLRGMHFQTIPGQAKLVSVIKGEIFDVVVDIRKDSATFKHWQGFYLDDQTRAQLYIPVGFAHGFCVLSEEAIVFYKVSSYFDLQTEKGFRYDDPAIGIIWPIENPILSSRDEQAPYLQEVLDE